MRTVLRALPCLLVVLSLASVAADDDLSARIRAREADIGKLTQEIDQTKFTLGERRIALWTAGHPADVLAQHQREVTRLDKAVAEAKAEKRTWEKRAGWDDDGFLGLCAYLHEEWIPYRYQAHGKKHREAADALEAAEKRRAEADSAFERRLQDGILVESPRPRVARGEDEGHVPRVYARNLAALRTMALKGGIEASAARSRISLLEAHLRETLARRQKAEDELHRLRFEVERRPDPERAPPRARTPPPLEVMGQVVGAVGHGKPEGYAYREQCTWKFRVRFTAMGDTDIFSWTVVSRRYVPAEVQRRRGPIRRIRKEGRFIELGPDYLTVRKEDGYRGTYELAVELEDEYGRTIRRKVVWKSPGRPPVGPPQSGLLGRFHGKPSAEWIRSVETRFRNIPVAAGERVELLDWSPEPVDMELHASPEGPIARLSGGHCSLRATWVDAGGRGSLDIGLAFAFLDGKRRPDGSFHGKVRITASGTGTYSNGTPASGSKVHLKAWRLVPEDETGRAFGLYLVDFEHLDEEKAFSLVRVGP